MKIKSAFVSLSCAALLNACATPVQYESVRTFAGSATAGLQDGIGNAAQLNRPHGMAIAADGTVYVSDRGNHQVRSVSPAGAVRILAGSGKQGFADGRGAAAQFHDPVAVAVDRAGNVYVADRNNHRVRKISPDGVVTTLAGTGQAGYTNGPANK